MSSPEGVEKLEGEAHAADLPGVEEILSEGLFRKEVEHHLRAKEDVLAEVVFETKSEIDHESGRTVIVSSIVVFEVCEAYAEKTIGAHPVKILSREIGDRDAHVQRRRHDRIVVMNTDLDRKSVV